MDRSDFPSTSKELAGDGAESDVSDGSGPPILQRMDFEFYPEEQDVDDTEPCPLSAEPSTSSVFREDYSTNIDQVQPEDEDIKPSTSELDSIQSDEKQLKASLYHYRLNSDSCIRSFSCILCQKICNDAYVMFCSYLHRFCKSCILSRWETGNLCCPRCGEECRIKPEQDETWNQMIEQFRLNTDIVLSKDLNRSPAISESETDIEQLSDESDDGFLMRKKEFYHRKDIRDIQKRLSTSPSYGNALVQDEQNPENEGKYYFNPHRFIGSQWKTKRGGLQSLEHLNYKTLSCNQNYAFPPVDVNKTLLGVDNSELFKRWKHFKKVARGMQNVNALVKHKKKKLLMDFAKNLGLENYVECTPSDDDDDSAMVKPTIESIKQMLLERKVEVQEINVRSQAASKPVREHDDLEPQPSTSRLDAMESELQDDITDADNSWNASTLNFAADTDERPRSARSRSEDERGTREPTEMESDAEATRDGIDEAASSAKMTENTPPKERLKRSWMQAEEERRQSVLRNTPDPKETVKKQVTKEDYDHAFISYLKSDEFGGTYTLEADPFLSAEEKEERRKYLEECHAKALAIMQSGHEGDKIEDPPQKKQSILLNLLQQPSLSQSTLVPISLVRMFDQQSRVPRCDFKRLNIQVQANIQIGHLIEFMYVKIANHYKWKMESLKKYIVIDFFEMQLSEDQDEDLDLKRCSEMRHKNLRPLPKNVLNRKKFFGSLNSTGEPKLKKEMKFRIPAYLMNPHPIEKGFCLPSRNGLVAFGNEVQLLSLTDVGLDQYCPPVLQKHPPEVFENISQEQEGIPAKEPQQYRLLKPKPQQIPVRSREGEHHEASLHETTSSDMPKPLNKKRRSRSGADSTTPSTASADSTPGASEIRKRRRKKTDPETDEEIDVVHYIPPHLFPDQTNPNFGSKQQQYPAQLDVEGEELLPCSSLTRGHHSTSSLPNAETETVHHNSSLSAPASVEDDSSLPPVLTPMISTLSQRPETVKTSVPPGLQPVQLPPGTRYNVLPMPQSAAGHHMPTEPGKPYNFPSVPVNLFNRRGQPITRMPQLCHKYKGTNSAEPTVREVAMKSVETMIEQAKEKRQPMMLPERIILNKLLIENKVTGDPTDETKKSKVIKVSILPPRKVRAFKISKKQFPWKSNRQIAQSSWEKFVSNLNKAEPELDEDDEDDRKFAEENPKLLEEMMIVPADSVESERSPKKFDSKPMLSLEQMRKKARMMEQAEKKARRRQKAQDRYKLLVQRDLTHIVRYKRFARRFRKPASLRSTNKIAGSTPLSGQTKLVGAAQLPSSSKQTNSGGTQQESPSKFLLKPGQRVLLPRAPPASVGGNSVGYTTTTAPAPSSSGTAVSMQYQSANMPPRLIPLHSTTLRGVHDNNAQIVTKDTEAGPQQYLSIIVAGGKEQLIPIQQSQNGQQVITANLAEIVQQASTTGQIPSRSMQLLLAKGASSLPTSVRPGGPQMLPISSSSTTNLSLGLPSGLVPTGFPRPGFMQMSGPPMTAGRGPVPTPMVAINTPPFQLTTIPTNSGPRQFVVTRTPQGQQYTQVPTTQRQFEVPTMQGVMKMITLVMEGRTHVMPIIGNGPPIHIPAAGSPMKMGPQMLPLPPNLVPVMSQPGQVVRIQHQPMQPGGLPRSIIPPNTLVPIQQHGQMAHPQATLRPGADPAPYTGSPVPVLYEKGVSPEPEERKNEEETEARSTTSDIPPSLSPAISVEEADSSQSDGISRKKSNSIVSISEHSNSKEKSVTSESDWTDKKDDEQSNETPTSTASAAKRKRGRPPKKFTGFYSESNPVEDKKEEDVMCTEESVKEEKDQSTPVCKSNQLHPDLSPPESNATLTAPVPFIDQKTPSKKTVIADSLTPKMAPKTPESSAKMTSSTPVSSTKKELSVTKRKSVLTPRTASSSDPLSARKKKKLRKTKKVYREPSTENARLVSLDGRYHRMLISYPMQPISPNTRLAELRQKVNLSSDESFVLVFSIRNRKNNID